MAFPSLANRGVILSPRRTCGNQGSIRKPPSSTVSKNVSKHQINRPEILPLTAIAKSQHEKIRRFQEQQLEQAYRKTKAFPSDMSGVLTARNGGVRSDTDLLNG